MSRFVDKSATDEIVLPGGDVVHVRQRLTAPEAAALKATLIRWRWDEATGSAKLIEADWHMQRIHVVKAYIISWDGPGFLDESGKPVPCTPEAVERLDEDTVRQIGEAIDDLQAKRREEFEKKE